jgi:hypothetical protein
VGLLSELVVDLEVLGNIVELVTVCVEGIRLEKSIVKECLDLA